MKKIVICIVFTYLYAFQGEIISTEFMDRMEIEEVQQSLDGTFGSYAPEAQYSISLYKIIYETIDPFGNPIEASGIISFPENLNQAFPILSFQHGTVVARDNVASESGFNPLSLWLTSTGYIYLEPDYIGLGESQIMHPYCLENPSAWSIIDILRASKQFCIESSEIESNEECSRQTRSRSKLESFENMTLRSTRSKSNNSTVPKSKPELKTRSKSASSNKRARR